jgi:exodeoxyribonuclease V alpha subunit
MMNTLTDIHRMFAESFPEAFLQAYAWLISKRLEEGHVCIGIHEPEAMKGEIPYPVCTPGELLSLSRLVGRPGDCKPFIIDGDRLYLHRNHRYETRIVDRIREMTAIGEAKASARRALLEAQAELIHSLAADYALKGLKEEECVDWQLVAALNALTDDFSIITGGPGTGKTTTLAKLLRILYACQPGAQVALAAPTGKAAMRMLESLKRSASQYPDEVRQRIEALKPSTLHRLLGWQKGSVNFKYNARRPLEYDFVVIDEASMVDLPMFAKLLDACGERTRLVLLGDKDQLASVEAGSLLGDLCLASDEGLLNGFEPAIADWFNGFIADPARRISAAHHRAKSGPLSGRIVELRLSHRFLAQGDIGRISRAIIAGDVAAVNAMVDAADSLEVSFDAGGDDAQLEDFILGYTDYIREGDPGRAMEKLNQLRVLVAVREGPRGLYAVNRRIEQLLQARGLLMTGTEFYHNRPVIVTRNNYELDLFNGDVGITRKVGDRFRVWFEGQDGQMRDVPAASLSHCETVFAMTIHKSQGSEFDRVLVLLPEGTDTMILTRELLYTGVTRAKKQVLLQASTDTLLHTTEQRVRRVSGVQHRLNH